MIVRRQSGRRLVIAIRGPTPMVPMVPMVPMAPKVGFYSLIFISNPSPKVRPTLILVFCHVFSIIDRFFLLFRIRFLIHSIAYFLRRTTNRSGEHVCRRAEKSREEPIAWVSALSLRPDAYAITAIPVFVFRFRFSLKQIVKWTQMLSLVVSNKWDSH